MKSHSTNPAENNLPPGIAEPDLVAAIVSSGYPLQGITCSRLVPEFNVVEEWGFVDDATKDHRSLDIYAYRPLLDVSGPNLHAGLNLLIECKRSRHPFVFFQKVVTQAAPRFPHIHGVPHQSIWIHEAGTNRIIDAWPALALGLDHLPFVCSGPPLCASFAKATPNGKKVELSGAEPFNTVVLPLVKALRHAAAQRPPPAAKASINPTLTLCLAVLDAPMLVVESPDSSDVPVLHPWVRVIRHESSKDGMASIRSRFYAIDVVHIGFLTEYLADHVLPFAEEFANRVAKSEKVLRYHGQVPDLKNWTWDIVAPRPEPR